MSIGLLDTIIISFKIIVTATAVKLILAVQFRELSLFETDIQCISFMSAGCSTCDRHFKRKRI